MAGKAVAEIRDPTVGGMPPIAEVAVAVLVLIVVGGIFTAAHLPRHAPLGVTGALLGAAAVGLLADAAMLSRLQRFAWGRFRQVAGWALLAYLVVAGMLEYVFVYDHTRGDQLVVLSLMLLVFALDIPLLLGFSVARHQSPDG
jgi:hypothetical protein